MTSGRVVAGLHRAVHVDRKRLGRPSISAITIDRVRGALDEGHGVRETARLLNMSAAKVKEIKRMAAHGRSLNIQH